MDCFGKVFLTAPHAILFGGALINLILDKISHRNGECVSSDRDICYSVKNQGLSYTFVHDLPVLQQFGRRKYEKPEEQPYYEQCGLRIAPKCLVLISWLLLYWQKYTELRAQERWDTGDLLASSRLKPVRNNWRSGLNPPSMGLLLQEPVSETIERFIVLHTWDQSGPFLYRSF